MPINNQPRTPYDSFTKEQKQVFTYYLEFRNDYLTPACFAEHKGFSLEYAEALLKEGRRLDNYFLVKTLEESKVLIT